MPFLSDRWWVFVLRVHCRSCHAVMNAFKLSEKRKYIDINMETSLYSQGFWCEGMILSSWIPRTLKALSNNLRSTTLAKTRLSECSWPCICASVPSSPWFWSTKSPFAPHFSLFATTSLSFPTASQRPSDQLPTSQVQWHKSATDPNLFHRFLPRTLHLCQYNFLFLFRDCPLCSTQFCFAQNPKLWCTNTIDSFSHARFLQVPPLGGKVSFLSPTSLKNADVSQVWSSPCVSRPSLPPSQTRQHTFMVPLHFHLQFLHEPLASLNPDFLSLPSGAHPLTDARHPSPIITFPCPVLCLHFDDLSAHVSSRSEVFVVSLYACDVPGFQAFWVLRFPLAFARRRNNSDMSRIFEVMFEVVRPDTPEQLKSMKLHLPWRFPAKDTPWDRSEATLDPEEVELLRTCLRVAGRELATGHAIPLEAGKGASTGKVVRAPTSESAGQWTDSAIHRRTAVSKQGHAKDLVYDPEAREKLELYVHNQWVKEVVIRLHQFDVPDDQQVSKAI